MTDAFVIPLVAMMTFAISVVLTGCMRWYAVRTDLLDRPNDRSSHTRPTPRGGGVAIVLSCMLALAFLAWQGRLAADLAWALLGAGSLVAVLGFVDDRMSLPARVRFTGHLMAAAWTLWWLGHIPPVPLFGSQLDLGVTGSLLSLLYIVWMVNLFNFMDGIDGIASIEAIAVTASGAVLWMLTGQGSGWTAAWIFAAATAGFLVWNFPPARIFMGDAGSGFLGLVVALLSLWCGRETPVLIWSWLILVGCFMVDATTTLVRRVRRGERFFEAHRLHAYQYASRRAGGHRPVTLAFAAVTLLWLLPIAALVATQHLDGAAGLLLAYIPLVTAAFRLKAGDRTAQEQ